MSGPARAGGCAARRRAPHGDNAPAYHKKFVQSLAPAALRANVSLFAPRCPRDLGCTTASFWQWEMTRSHDPDWLGARIDEAIARYAADPKRVVAVGYSGGATYLGYYASSHPERFVAVAHVSGGSTFGVTACPSIKYPVLFYLGATRSDDPVYRGRSRAYLRRVRRARDVVWRAERGVTHVGMLDRLANGGADDVIAWLVAHAGAPAPAPPAPTPRATVTSTSETPATPSRAPAAERGGSSRARATRGRAPTSRRLRLPPRCGRDFERADRRRARARRLPG